jgi:hypothetical protein
MPTDAIFISKPYGERDLQRVFTVVRGNTSTWLTGYDDCLTTSFTSDSRARLANVEQAKFSLILPEPAGL